ncbi:MAG TPA: phosphoribosylamine--glycine ligase, partial [Prolixibacteraceae bacterium]|nr:phosphoribosylamine--glycine ligase [Prolixibacteraceae bacterium]
MINILIVGSGGREHAMAWKIKQSPLLNQLFIAPGNPGTSLLGTNLPVGVSDFEGLKKAALGHRVDLILVGPEVPLCEGLHDYFLADSSLQHVKVVGPQKLGAQLEGSKDFAKEFMMRHQIPTAKYYSVTQDTLSEGLAFLKTMKAPYVLKADGLAAGKGVLIISDLIEAENSLKEMLNGQFGAASSKVVVEEFL